MEIRGKIIQKLEPVSGTSKAGNAWNKQEYVLQTEEAYPKNVFFDFFGDKANQYPLEVGDTINLSFDIESREWNGKWFTSIRGWKAEKIDPNAAPADMPPAQEMGAPSAPANPFDNATAGAMGAAALGNAMGGLADAADDLPF